MTGGIQRDAAASSGVCAHDLLAPLATASAASGNESTETSR
jgi:hypothetical protein